MKTLELSFEYEYHGVKYFHPVRSILVVPAISGEQRVPVDLLVVDGTAVPLDKISDIRLTVLEKAGR